MNTRQNHRSDCHHQSPSTFLVLITFLLSFIISFSSGSVRAETVTLRAEADTTLNQGAPDNNMGGHDQILAGTTGTQGGSSNRRGLFRFDIAGSIPADATINSATLALTVTGESQDGSGEVSYSLHRALVSWGEGDKNGSSGQPADSGEATWNEREFGISGWNEAGGTADTDYVNASSATATVNGLGIFSWNGLKEDVQFWLDNSDENFGWKLISDSEGALNTARRFGSSEHAVEANRPALTVEFTSAEVSGGIIGPSTTTEPYITSAIPGTKIYSLLTVGDEVPNTDDGNTNYATVGILDGMAAFDNGDDTFTLLVNHELNSGDGVTRAHGGTGAFVSEYIINRNDFSVTSGRDLTLQFFVWNGAEFVTDTDLNKSRFCSADLPPITAFFNSDSGLGTQNRIYVNGEETGAQGRAFGHVITGSDSRNSYHLPHLGRASWENLLASPFEQDKTIVVGLDDSNDGEVYIYTGTKNDTGATDVEKAGLVGGNLYVLKVDGKPFEVGENTELGSEEVFELVNLGDVSGLDGNQITEAGTAAGATKFGRPEDGVWDPRPGREQFFYFVTTGGTTDGNSTPARLWEIEFNDMANPENGGTLRILLSEEKPGPRFEDFDNMTMTQDGKIYIQEDTGGSIRLAKIWEYDTATGSLEEIAAHNPKFFHPDGSDFLTTNEESSGIIPLTEILGEGWFALNVQAHFSIPGELAEGGQLVLMDLSNRGGNFRFESLVTSGEPWKFLANGNDPGAEWPNLAFDDSSWLEGASQLGYGDNDEVTVIDDSTVFATYYFRKTVTIANASEVTNLDLFLLRDDGAVVYINGEEILRDNMPAGVITNETFASGAIGGESENAFQHVSIPSSFLNDGDNVIAVSIHQSSLTSSDISFDLELFATRASADEGEIPEAPTELAGVANSSTEIGLTWIDNANNELGFQLERQIGNGPWMVLDGNVIPDLTSFTDDGLLEETEYAYRVRAFNIFGVSEYSNTVTVTTLENPLDLIEGEDFSSGTLGFWTAISLASNADWFPSERDGIFFAEANGFGADEASDDWLISPPINLNTYIDEVLTFDTIKGFDGPDLEVLVSTDYVQGDDPSTATWQPLAATLSPGDFQQTPSGDIDLSAIQGKEVFVAFHYISTGTGGGDGAIWRVVDIQIRGTFQLPEIIPTKDFQDQSLDPWTSFDVSSNRSWRVDDADENYFADMNGFGGDGNDNDWLISPPLDLDAVDEAFLSFESRRRFGDGSTFRVLVSTNYFGNGNPEEATWTELSPVLPTIDQEQEWIFSDFIDLKPFSGPSVFVAFHYVTLPADAPTRWRVDNIAITSTKPESQFNVDFAANNTTPRTIDPVQFTALVSGEEGTLTYAWDFGDNETSDLQNPEHTYSSAGTFTVSLTVTDDNGSLTETKPDFIVVTKATQTEVPENQADIRVATFNASLNRPNEGELISDLSTPDNEQARQIAEVIQRVRADIILINEFDFDENGEAADLFKTHYLEVSQNGADPIEYPYIFLAPSNTGIASGFDLDNNGEAVTTPGALGYGNDSFGFGEFPGRFAMVVYSRFPIIEDQVRTFQNFLWKDMPNAFLPDDPTTAEPADWYSPEELDVFRLSSKSHWDIPVEVNDDVIHVLVSHPTPPVFDGDEDRNGRRNHDEIRFWADYIDPAASDYIYDDAGVSGGLNHGERFVVLGDQNADPNDGDSTNNPILLLLDSPFVNKSLTPRSEGGLEQNDNGASQVGDPAEDTSTFALRVDYVLPSRNGFHVDDGAVFWPPSSDVLADIVTASDHRLVYLDLDITGNDPRKSISSIQFIGEVTFPTGFMFNDTEVGGLSGIVYDADANHYLALSDDRSQINDARYYTLTIDLADGSLDDGDVAFTDVITLLNQDLEPFPAASIDPEGIVLTSKGTLFIASEGDANNLIDPFVNEFNIDGSQMAELPVPPKFLPTADQSSGIRNNLAFESLTLSSDHKFLYTATENALFQDGPQADLDNESLSRIIKYDLANGEAVQEFVYIVDSVPSDSNPPGGFITNGLVELLAIDNDGTLLALERSFSVGIGNGIKLYEARTQGALDVATANDLFREDAIEDDGEILPPGPFEIDPPAEKRLILDLADLGITLDNVEGMTMGPTLEDGRKTLILVSDNNFNANGQFTQFLAFSIELAETPAVPAIAETPRFVAEEEAAEAGDNLGDADDPAIWLNPSDASDSLVIGSLKDGGLAVFDLDGNILQLIQPTQFGDVRYNNVDVLYGFELNGEGVDLVIASDRENDTLAIFKVTNQNELEDVTSDSILATIFGVDDGEQTAYGLANYKSPLSGESYVFVSQREGNKIAQLKLVDDGSGKVDAEIVRTLELPVPTGDPEDSQSEGLVVDQERGLLYVALEEEVGILRFNAAPDGGDESHLIHPIDSDFFTPDIEGLTIYYGPNGTGYLITSSQGDSTFAVFDRQGDNDYIGSFTVGGQGEIDQVNESDGVDVTNVALGPQFPFGLLVVQDGATEPQVLFEDDEELENSSTGFKLVPWENVAHAFDEFLIIDTEGFDPRNPANFVDDNPFQFNILSTVETEIFDEGAAEIAAFDPSSRRMFFTNAFDNSFEIVDLSDPNDPVRITTVDLSPFGDGVNSIATKNGFIAVAVEADPVTDPGSVVFFDLDGNFIASVLVGALPDMITFTQDGTRVLVANEGEPDDGVDPEGSVSIIFLPSDDLTGLTNDDVVTAEFKGFDGRENELRNRGIRIFEGKTTSQDVEPEYIAESATDGLAFVTLQENNAFGIVDIDEGTILDILPLGVKDHSKGLPVIKNYELTGGPNIADDQEVDLTTPAGQTIGLGGFSGLFYVGENSENGNLQFVTIPDRGPNPDTISLDLNEDGNNDTVRPFAFPRYQARIVHLELNQESGDLIVTNQTFLTRKVNNDTTEPITGIPNVIFDTDGFQIDEQPVDLDGNLITSLDRFGGDMEGIVIDRDESDPEVFTYWTVDEYRPAIYHFDMNGVLIDRFVPIGLADSAGEPAGTFGTETLPTEYSNRRRNRGFEAIALDESSNTLFAFIQTPLANPDRAASDDSNVIRILAIDTTTGDPTAEYVYLLEGSDFRESKVDKIGDAVYAGDNKLFVIERDSSTDIRAKKFIFEVDLTGATNLLDGGIVYIADKTVEQHTADELASIGVRPVNKIKVLNLPSIGYRAGDKPEGLALLPDGALAVINDNDFGLADVDVLEVQDNNDIASLTGGGVIFQDNPVPTVLGLIHFTRPNGLDPSDRDDVALIRNTPVFGMFMPDAMAAYEKDGRTYFLTANEGDDRGEDERVGDLENTGDPALPALDPSRFPDADELTLDENTGRLGVSTVDGDLDEDGDYDQLFAYGARSFSIWDDRGNLIYDSGDEFEQITARLVPEFFNSDNDENTFDTRSDAKGPEPEAVTTGKINGRIYGFIGLERIGGIMVYDITDPFQPFFVTYVNNRDFKGDPEAGTAGDLGVEGLVFVSPDDSPTGDPLLIAANEVSGTVTTFGIDAGTDDGFLLTILHNNDGESQLIDAGSGLENFGGIARFNSLVDQLRTDATDSGSEVLVLSSGDNFLAGPEFSASLEAGVFYDAIALESIGYDAIQLGNHDFDFGPNLLADFINSFKTPVQYLAGNLDFGGEPVLQNLVDNGRIAPSVVIDKGGEKIGIVGAVTPNLPFISSPGNVMLIDVDNDGDSDTADIAILVQAEIDTMTAAGVNKIVLISHLQGIDEDLALIPLLSGVDVAIAGGGDELLANADNRLIPGDEANIFGPYPLNATNADGDSVPVVTTPGSYRYVGRLEIEFDDLGNVVAASGGPVRVSGIKPDPVEPDPELLTSVVEPIEEFTNNLATNIIANSEVDLDGTRNGVRGGETNLGNVIADALLSKATELAGEFGVPHPQVAMQNGGGIRNDSIIPAGPVTELDTFDILPFGNFVTIVENVSPAQLKQLMENAVSALGGGSGTGRFAQVAGMKVEYDTNQVTQVIDGNGNIETEGERIRSITLDDGTEVVVNGEVVPSASSVNVATVDFLARGGDQYPFGDAPFTVLGVSYQQALASYLIDGLGGVITEDQYPVGGEGRLVDLANQGNAPPVAGDDAAETDEDTPVTLNVLANDSDPDGDTLSVDAILIFPNGGAGGTKGSVTNNGDGTVTYDPNGQFEDLNDGDQVTDGFSYTVSDGKGGTDSATVSITINGVTDQVDNNPPIAEEDAAATDEDSSVVVDVLANDSDPDGNTLSVDAIDMTGTKGSVTNNGDGTVTYDPNGQFEDLNDGDQEVDSFAYTVSDGNGGTGTGIVTITISGVTDGDNNPPVVAGVLVVSNPDPATENGTLIAFPIGISDPDGDEVEILFQWRNGGNDIAGATASTLDNNDGTFFVEGDEITVVITPFDGKDEGASVESSPITIGSADPSDIWAVTPETVNFGDVGVALPEKSGPCQLTVQLKNMGSEDQTVDGISSDNPDFDYELIGDLGQTVEPDEVVTIFVTATPTAVGASMGDLTIETSSGPVVVPVKVIGSESANQLALGSVVTDKVEAGELIEIPITLNSDKDLLLLDMTAGIHPAFEFFDVFVDRNRAPGDVIIQLPEKDSVRVTISDFLDPAVEQGTGAIAFLILYAIHDIDHGVFPLVFDPDTIDAIDTSLNTVDIAAKNGEIVVIPIPECIVGFVKLDVDQDGDVGFRDIVFTFRRLFGHPTLPDGVILPDGVTEEDVNANIDLLSAIACDGIAPLDVDLNGQVDFRDIVFTFRRLFGHSTLPEGAVLPDGVTVEDVNERIDLIIDLDFFKPV